MNKNKNLAFTLAEVLIVIGIIGVVAALTLPNLNHATGDKETVTRLQKAYSILNEANDRAVAIYGPISTWPEECQNVLSDCWMKRIGEFLKISKYCDVSAAARAAGTNVTCEESFIGNLDGYIVYQLSDGITFSANGACPYCEGCERESVGGFINVTDLCDESISVDINGPNKGKNSDGIDQFRFMLSDSLGLLPEKDGRESVEEASSICMSYKNGWQCTWWVMEFGNLDYLKADTSGKCNDSNIILDGVTNTSCH